MKDLTTLLGRFLKSLGKDTLAKEIVLDVIRNQTNINLKVEDVSLKEGTLEISTTPAKKNEINLKEESILSEIQSRTGQNIFRIFYK